MRGALQLACDYAKERHQYGTAIGSFQSIQHLLADALVAMEGTRSAALHAAWAVDALPPANEIGRAHVCTPVPNAPLVCRLLPEQNIQNIVKNAHTTHRTKPHQHQ